jgi:lipoic acid synthetase
LVQIGGERAPAAGGAREGRAARPQWLRIRMQTPARYHEVRRLVDRLSLHTVCQEAHCPNIYECWGEHGTATFMILGEICTRRCGFCAVTSGRPRAGVDDGEPAHVAEAIAAMGLAHAVITSVDRDDLPDGGAAHWARVVAAVHERVPACSVEVLTPDFRGVPDALDVVLAARPEIFSHNTETVPRLYRKARPGSRYDRTLALLADAASRRDAGTYAGRVKTSIMVGLGETNDEVRATMGEIRAAGVDIVSIGQYLQPTSAHLPVDRFVAPEEFAEYRTWAAELGFAHCQAGPLVRSSYHAHEQVSRPLREALAGP